MSSESIEYAFQSSGDSTSSDDSEVESIMDSETSEDETSSSSTGDTEEEETVVETEEEEEEEDPGPWSDWIEDVFGYYQQDMRDAVADLVEHDDISRDQAECEVYEDYLPRMNKRLRGKLVKFMCHTREMKRDPTYKKIVQTAQRLRIEDEMDYEEAVTQAAENRKLLITRTLQQWTPSLSDDEDTDESEIETL
jgi:hypothetical protein